MGDINDRHVYLLTDEERQLVQGGPALLGPDGTRYDVPPRVFEALREVEELLRSGKAVQIRRLEPELGIGPAADVINMRSDTLRSYIEKGEIRFRKTGIVHWLRLADVLDFDRRLMKQRAAAMQELANEERWDEDGSADSGSAR